MENLQGKRIDVTIAVPVYNVENYLRRCLNSLVSQSYEYKEILIVNDGSDDDSLGIIQEYAKKYSFVRYIDQPNAGLAEVRNICVREALGEYISFIDSDDFVVEGLYEHIMPIIIKYNVDIMCYGVINLYENKRNTDFIKNINTYAESIKIFTAEQALDEFLLPNNIDVITCNKIIKRSLYEGILYPVGKLYEDMFTNYKLIAKAKNIYTTNYKYYVYCHRDSSIGGMKYNEKTMDLYSAFTEVYNYSLVHGLDKPVYLHVGYATWLVIVLNIMIRSGYKDDAYKKQVIDFVKKHIKEINNSTYLNTIRKVQFNILIISYALYKYAYLKYISIT